MKSSTIKITVFDTRFKYPVNNINVDLYNYLPTIIDGTINGIKAVTTNGSDATSNSTDDPFVFEFQNIPKGKYSVVVSGYGIQAHIPTLLDEIEVLPYNVTGTELQWNDSTTESIATKILALEQRIQNLENS